MLLNVNKTTKLYSIKDDGKRVVNNYVLLFQNTQRKAYTYHIEIVGKYKGKIQLHRFKPFKLAHGKLSKKVIQLSTTERLIDTNKKDTPLTVMLHAYASEDPQKISVLRKAVFIYPRADKLK
jgi:hypothetical protein